MESVFEENSLIRANIDRIESESVDGSKNTNSISALTCQYQNTVSVICSSNEFLEEDPSLTFQSATKISLNKYRKIQPQPETNLNKRNASTIVMLDSTNSQSIHELSNTSNNSNSILQVEQLHVAGYFCNICNYFYQGSTHCPAHTEPTLVILDSPIPTQARLTLPKQLYLQKSGVVTGATGVWTQVTIEKKSQFGPLVGKTINKEEIDGIHISDKNNLWKIYHDGELTYGLEADDENQCNWMKFVQRARTSAEQNIVAFLLSSQIYFMTTKTISPDTELLYWFSTDFCSLLGVPIKPEDGFECSECSKKFLTFNALNRHTKYLHASTAGRKFQCSMCQKFFTSASKLSIHALGHMGIKPHTCNICNKQFSDASNLRGHLSIHTGERRFKCSTCSKTFRQKAHLVSHMLTHTGEKKYKCRCCDRWFARTSDLRQHEIIHNCERVYPCPVCKKTFYRLQTQKKHLKVHGGQRDFECSQCKKRFFTKYHLERHCKSCRGKESGKL